MNDSKDYRQWIAIADRDLEFASKSIDEHDEFYSQICYFFQQATEKYLKAYILKNNLQFKKTHDLPFLLSVCQKDDSEFGEYTDECSFLNRFSVDIKYPAVYEIGIAREDAERARDAAKKIGDFVKKKIELTAAPSRDYTKEELEGFLKEDAT